MQDCKKSSVSWRSVPIYDKQLFHLTSFPLHVSQWSDEAQVFTTDVISVSFDEEIALDNFTFFFFL